MVNATELYEFKSEMYYYLIKYPADTILMFDEVLNQLLLKHFIPQEEHNMVERKIKTRITTLQKQTNFRQLNPVDIN